MKKYPFIDSARGLAILGVLLVHSSMYTENLSPIVAQIVSQGARGVQLFFILSSLTIFISLDRRKKLEKNKLFINFFIRRFFRVAPLYYFSIFLYLNVHGMIDSYWLGGLKQITISNILAHIFFINVWNPYWINSILGVEWSIAVEMTFYLIIPIIFKRITNLNKSIIFLLESFIFSILVNNLMNKIDFIPQKNLWYDFIFIGFPGQLSIFALGIILYYLLFKEGNIKIEIENIKNKKTFSYICLVVSLYLFIAFSSEGNKILRLGSYELIPIYFLYSLFMLIFIYGLAVYPTKIIVNKFTIFLGKISYSIYLIHFLIIKLTLPLFKEYFRTNTFFMNNNSNGLKLLFGFIIMSSITIPLSYASYMLIEKPMLNIGSMFIQLNDKTSC